MYDMKPLEEEWLRYQTKKRKPWYILFIFLITIILILFFVINQHIIKHNFFEKYFSLNHLSQNHVVLSYNKSMTLLNGALERIEIVPIDNSEVSNATPSISSSNVTSSDMLVDIPILDNDGDTLQSNVHQTDNRSNVHLDIIETTSLSAYKDVEKRFHQSHDIDDALFLAKSYYKKENYKKAAHWAFEANKLDATLEDSVLIFVKSKIKLGNKNEALAILNQYVKNNDSKDARVLLEKIKNNSF